MVIGGGVAGLQAAKAAAESGAKVLVLIEENKHWGGRAPVDGGTIDGEALWISSWIEKTLVSRCETMDNVTLRDRCMGARVSMTTVMCWAMSA